MEDRAVKYSSFDISMIFDEIWESWISKVGEASAKKAFTVAINQGEDPEKMKMACRAYVLDVDGTDPTYTMRLGNFIRDDHWKDISENVSLSKLESRRKESAHLIDCWNKACQDHWCKVLGVDSRIPLARMALDNLDFRKNWERALSLASKVFKFKFVDSDPRSKVSINFRWFCTLGVRHTVLRIIEGEYGYTHRERSDPKSKSFRTPTEEERRKAVEMFSAIMSGDELEQEIDEHEPEIIKEHTKENQSYSEFEVY